MIRWCSYCYSYQGQATPLDDFRVTHGTCEACQEKFDRPTGAAPGAGAFFAGLRDLSARLSGFAHAPSGSDAEAQAYCRQALGLGLDPADILLSLLQPALYQVGQRFAQGTASAADEHGMTEFARRMLDYLRREARLREPATAPPADVLLVAADGNGHTLGPSMLEILLAEHGYRCVTVVPGLSLAEIQDLAQHWQPSLLGVSVSMRDQAALLGPLADWARRRLPRTRLVAGGAAFLDPTLEAPPGVTAVAPLLGTRQTLAVLRYLGLEKGKVGSEGAGAEARK